MDDYVFVSLLSKNIINNYLSYLYFITKKENSFDSIYFHNSHIKTFINHKGIEDDIVKDIENRFEEIQNNYKNYLITNRKYTRILEEYNKLFKYTLMTSEYNKINEKKRNLKN